MTNTLNQTDQLWLLQHARGRLPAVEKQQLEASIGQEIEAFWRGRLPQKTLVVTERTNGHLANLDIEKSIQHNPLLSDKNLYFRTPAPQKLHMVFVLDASLSLRTPELWKLYLLVYGLQQLATSIELIVFSTEAERCYFGKPIWDTKIFLSMMLGQLKSGYTNIECGLKAGLRAMQRHPRQQSQLICITDGGWNMGRSPQALQHMMSKWIFILLSEETTMQAQFQSISRQYAQYYALDSVHNIPKMSQKVKRFISYEKYRQ